MTLGNGGLTGAVLLSLIAASRGAAAGSRVPQAGAVIERNFGSGWAKAASADAPSTPQAATLSQDNEKHAQVAHMSITRVAFMYYASRYKGGELAAYIGQADGLKPASDTPDNVVSGSFDEDEPNKNPWNDLIPELRHFWDCRKGPYAGLLGNDSSVDRAQKYFTGGFGLNGDYDSGWSAQETRGNGILGLYRGGNKAKAYWYLGHAAHLLEDATVPAHVLLFPHPYENADAYETYMQTHYWEWETKVPQGPVDSFATLYDLFYRTADVTNEFDAGSGPGLAGRDGRKDGGARRNGGFTEKQLRAEGDVLMPLAYRRVASIFLSFFRQIDHTPPRVTLAYPRSGKEDAPDLTADSEVTLSARAVDDLSGVDRVGYRFEYSRWTGAAWSGWRQASTKPTESRLAFDVEPSGRYAFRVSAVDAAGNRAFSAIGYLTAVSAEPAVASTR